MFNGFIKTWDDMCLHFIENCCENYFLVYCKFKSVVSVQTRLKTIFFCIAISFLLFVPKQWLTIKLNSAHSDIKTLDLSWSEFCWIYLVKNLKWKNLTKKSKWNLIISLKRKKEWTGLTSYYFVDINVDRCWNIFKLNFAIITWRY